MTSEPSFNDRYGPWAVICGASDGVGEKFAHTLARQGLNLILISRRRQPLDDIAALVTGECGVEARVLTLDLAAPDAVERIRDATAMLEVGMLVYCAGSDSSIKPFRERNLEDMTALVQRNCVTPLALCHHFGPAMEDRGRGGIILLSSGGGLQGIPNIAAYSASKAFDIVLGEALWAEWQGAGVDVLSLVLTTTDTPAYRRTLASQGVISSVHETPDLPGLVPPQQVVDEALANLKNGPTWFVSEQFRGMEKQLRSLSRNDAVRAVLSHTQPVTRD